jgi:uncharacterized protein YdaU (DUF1376 family)
VADLHWFPFYPKDWLSGAGVQMMQPEQRGAFIQLLALAWGEGDETPSLPSDDEALASLSGLGARWRKLGAIVRKQFTEDRGRLYNAKLSEIWNESQIKHEKAVERGNKSAKARAERREKESRTSSRSSSKDLEQLQSQSQLQDELERGPKGPSVLASSAPSGALALEGARASAPDANAAGTSSDTAAEIQALEGEYFRRLESRVEQWQLDNPDEAIALEAQTRAEMGLPATRELGDFQRSALREQLIVKIRRLKGWPDCDQWIHLEKSRANAVVAGNADRAANDIDRESEAAD